jgi:C4-dicarboxylate transporter DctM subunit
MAIPFFMLAGEIMARSGITRRLVEFANALVGWIKCGLCYVAIVAGIFMGGISGSAPADTAALGAILIPTMKEQDYPAPFAAALLASAGAIGIIIPPSIPMVVLGGVSGVSIGKLFVGGIIPGVILGLCLMVAARLTSNRKKYGQLDRTPFTLQNLWTTFKRAILPLLAPFILIVGILSGFFSATEASVVVVVYSSFVGIVIYRTIKIRDMVDICASALKSTANVMLVIGASTIFSWILTRHNIPAELAAWILAVGGGKAFFLAFVIVVVFVAGMFLDGLPIIIMLVPIFLPIAQSLNIDPIMFGVMFTLVIAVGGLTPPVGATMFVGSQVAKCSIMSTAKEAIPLIIAMLVTILLVCIFPGLVTWLPSVMKYS